MSNAPKPPIKSQSFVAPHSKESEMMVLGCMLTSVNSLNVAADSLDTPDFYFKEHKLIFKALKAAYTQDKPADVHIVAETLKQSNDLTEAKGVAYLTTLAQYAGTSAHIEEYISIVRDRATLRRMLEAAKSIEKHVIEEKNDVTSILDEAQNAFFTISQRANSDKGLLIGDILSGNHSEKKLPYLKELEERQEAFAQKDPNAPAVTGLPTHFTDLDKMINGLNPANLVIVAGRPSMGKTALCLNIVEQVAFKSDAPVALFSLEMTADELIHRMICSQSEVESDKIRTGALDGHEYQRILSTVNELKKKPIVIDDQAGLKITDLRARARRLKEIYGIKLIVIDYLQLLSGSRSHYNTENRQNEISEISRMLKTLARELSIPVICLSQLSRKVDERAGHRPMLSDLRESGSIEQDADIVMFLFRPEYYNPSHKPGLTELIVAKNRHGKVGSVNLTYRKTIAQFTNHIGETEESQESTSSAFSAFDPV